MWKRFSIGIRERKRELLKEFKDQDRGIQMGLLRFDFEDSFVKKKER